METNETTKKTKSVAKAPKNNGKQPIKRVTKNGKKASNPATKSTAETPPPAFSWNVKAYCFDSSKADTPKEKYIAIPSREQSLEMPGSKIRSGMPVDANLAVYFIKNFFDHYTIYFEDHEQTMQALINNNDMDGMKDLHKKVKTMHDNIVNLTYGMTLDKDLILKIISQPKCEGVRFYLCSRKTVEDGYMHLSLVTVGVDKDGYDLHYNLPKTLKANAETGASEMTTQSLTVEYMTPPPPYGFSGKLNQNSIDPLMKKTETEYQDRFVLLNTARNQK